jgi:hypothetical protein
VAHIPQTPKPPGNAHTTTTAGASPPRVAKYQEPCSGPQNRLAAGRPGMNGRKRSIASFARMRELVETLLVTALATAIGEGLYHLVVRLLE